jgi:branched-chain amino acid aminotransferase
MKHDLDYSKGAAWMDGEVIPISEAKISVLDWGFTRSDVTYDVTQVWQGAFFRLDDYLDRFHESMAKTRLEVPQNKDDMRQILHEMVARSGLTDAYVAMVASRGTPQIPGSRDPRHCKNHFFAWCIPWLNVIPEDVAARGAHLKIAESVRRIPIDSVDPTAKNYHWGDLTKGLFEAKDAGFDTVILLDHQGRVTEGAGFNVFGIINGVVVTPRQGALEGITRRTVLEVAKELGMETAIRDISAEEFLEAEEVFTATTAGGVTPVARVNDRIFTNDALGPVTMKLKDHYWDWHSRQELNEKIKY